MNVQINTTNPRPLILLIFAVSKIKKCTLTYNREKFKEFSNSSVKTKTSFFFVFFFFLVNISIHGHFISGNIFKCSL
jgi:hypothetical protein